MIRGLYGGALSCHIPSSFSDVSEFRQVPNNQEVFAEAVSDRCIIVELLQMEEKVSNESSAYYYFQEIADSNACTANDRAILQTISIPESEVPGLRVPAHIVVGTQKVAKFKETAKNVIQVFVCCIRLPQVTTDVVISVTVPLQINPDSSSQDIQATNAEEGHILLKNIIGSLSVSDWSLFQ